MNTRTLSVAALAMLVLGALAWMSRHRLGESAGAVSGGALQAEATDQDADPVSLERVPEKRKVRHGEEKEGQGTALAPESSPPPSEPDASGLTQEEKLTSLLNAYERLMGLPQDASTELRVDTEYSFTKTCIKNILREGGRADYGNPAELEAAGGFSLRPRFPGERVFASDRARYSFMKGEFPVYEAARTRKLLITKGKDLRPITDQQLQTMYDSLFQEALNSLGVQSIEGNRRSNR